MPRMNFAASRLINPPGVFPKLTEDQVWKGLEFKSRQPKGFVAAIKSCEVISDNGNKVVRSVSFGNEPVIENIELFQGTIIYFDAPSIGSRITNLLSYDTQGELILTFSFAGGIPGVVDTDGPPPSVNDLNRTVGAGVEHTIERIRELVKGGSIV